MALETNLNAPLQAELNTLIRKLESVADSAKRDRDRILTEAAGPLRSAIAGRAPQSDKAHSRYSTPKLSGKLRAPKGSGRVVATYQPGNLRKSIQTLRFKRSKAVFIGPKVRRSAGQMPDGYYAHMVNFAAQNVDGTTRSGQHFVEAGVRAAGDTSIRIASQLLKRKIESYAAQKGLK